MKNLIICYHKKESQNAAFNLVKNQNFKYTFFFMTIFSESDEVVWAVWMSVMISNKSLCFFACVHIFSIVEETRRANSYVFDCSNNLGCYCLCPLQVLTFGDVIKCIESLWSFCFFMYLQHTSIMVTFNPHKGHPPSCISS